MCQVIAQSGQFQNMIVCVHLELTKTLIGLAGVGSIIKSPQQIPTYARKIKL